MKGCSSFQAISWNMAGGNGKNNDILEGNRQFASAIQLQKTKHCITNERYNHTDRERVISPKLHISDDSIELSTVFNYKLNNFNAADLMVQA